MYQTDRRPLALAALLIVAAATLTACGSDKPAVCDSVDALQTSVGNLKEVKIGENGLATLKTNITQIGIDLRQVKADAKQQYATELSQVDQASTSTKSAISAAKATPSVTTFGAVATSVSALSTAVKGLSDAVSSSC